MINESTSLVRRIFWMVSIGIAIAGFFLMASVDLSADIWLKFELAGFAVFILGSILTIIFNDPICFLAALGTLGIVVNYALCRVFNLRTKTTQKCYRIMRRHGNALYDIYFSAYNAIYAMHSIEPIVHRED